MDQLCSFLNNDIPNLVKQKKIKKVIHKELSNNGEVKSDDIFFKSLYHANAGKPSEHYIAGDNSLADSSSESQFKDMHNNIDNISIFFSSNTSKCRKRYNRAVENVKSKTQMRRCLYADITTPISKAGMRRSSRLETLKEEDNATFVPIDMFTSFCENNFCLNEHAQRELRKAEIIKEENQKLLELKSKRLKKNTDKDLKFKYKKKRKDRLSKLGRTTKINSTQKVKKKEQFISYAKKEKIIKSIKEKVFLKVPSPNAVDLPLATPTNTDAHNEEFFRRLQYCHSNTSTLTNISANTITPNRSSFRKSTLLYDEQMLSPCRQKFNCRVKTKMNRINNENKNEKSKLDIACKLNFDITTYKINGLDKQVIENISEYSDSDLTE